MSSCTKPTANAGSPYTADVGQPVAATTTAAIAPAPTASPGGPYNADVGQTVTFDGSKSTGAVGQALTYAWDFGDGSTGAGVTASHSYSTAGSFTVALTVTDRNGGANAARTNAVIASAAPNGFPTDPAIVAPPVAQGVATNVGNATSFLYTGTTPIQTGVSPNTIDAKRAAVVRGRVLDKTNTPLSGVTVTVLNHPEFGQTISRADGMFDLAVNGGGPLAVNYRLVGFLPAQRQVDVPWQDYAFVPDVVLVNYDSVVNTIDLGSAATIQVARGSPVSDSDGTRQATLFVAGGTNAVLNMPDGSTRPITHLTVRGTEYTVGTNGAKAMPGELPPTSAYTYAIEWSVDEAVAAGASGVTFSQPVVSYVENFLGYTVGEIVPVGYFDSQKGAWIASPNGAVVKILSVTSSLADLDVDGSGQPASAAALAALGIVPAERQRLASLYQIGQTLWRVPVTHFSALDLNWPFCPVNCGGADSPHQSPQQGDPLADPTECPGSIIECENQTVGQRVPITGTPYTINYRSGRASGTVAARSVAIPLSGATLPSVVIRIELQVSVAGKQFAQTFSAAPNQSTTFTWDGNDAYGRKVQGRQQVTVRIGYVYQATRVSAANFAAAFAFYGANSTADRTRNEITLWQTWKSSLGALESGGDALGGWSLDVHHTYDPIGKTIYLGDGTRRFANQIPNILITVAGNGSSAVGGDGGPATASPLSLNGVAVGQDGSVYISDLAHGVVRRVGPDGIITRFAGTYNQLGNTGDNGAATSAKLFEPRGMAVGTDGSVYIADSGSHVVRRVRPDGIIERFAGTGVAASSGDGGPALLAQLSSPQSVAVARDGSVFIGEYDLPRVRRVGPDGYISTWVGTGSNGYSGDGGPANRAMLHGGPVVAVAPNGNLYIGDYANCIVRKVGPDGIIRTVAGVSPIASAPQCGNGGDGGPATQAKMGLQYGIAVGPDEALYIYDSSNRRIRAIGQDGIIRTVGGTGAPGFSADGTPATQALLGVEFNGTAGIAVTPDGAVVFDDFDNHRARRIGAGFPGVGLSDYLISSPEGREVYDFDPQGRHLRTFDALTGAIRYQFAYDAGGRLTTITDAAGNVTAIAREANGAPTGIVGPFDQLTKLTLDTNGHLASITDPAGQATTLTSTSTGLLATLTDPRGATHRFTYDALGRLTLDTDPAGGSTALTRADSGAAFDVTRTTALGRVTTFHVANLPNGDQQRVITLPSGLKSVSVRGADGINTETVPDGTRLSVTNGPDPRFGMLAPVPIATRETTPLGLALSTAMTRTATLSNPSDPLTLTALNDRLTVNGKVFTRDYSTAARTFTHKTPVGRQIIVTLDALGRPSQSQVAGLNTMNWTYDSHGRLATVSAGTGVDTRTFAFTYNSAGFLDTLTDPLSRKGSFVYDAVGRVITQVLPGARQIQYAYDGNGNVTSLTPPGRPAHNFAYTSVDLMSAYSPPDVSAGTNQTVYAYNADRQLTVASHPDARSIALGYDGAGRRNALNVSRGTISFGYDTTKGTPTSISAPDGVNLTYTYDGALQKSGTLSGPVAGAVARTYNNNFRVSSLAVNGNSIALTYDDDSLLISAGGLSLARSPLNGLITGSTLGNVTDAWTYNGFAESTNYNVAYGGTTVLAQAFTRDLLGRISQKVETIGGSTDTYVYSYDQAGRLTDVTKNGASVATYTYDLNGNRLSVTTPRGMVNGAYDAQDRLTQYGAASYNYAANGELATKTDGAQVTTYTYDELGNLTAVALPSSSISYLIDGRNRRVGKKVNGALTQGFLYQDALKPIAELDGSNGVVSRFVYATRVNVPDYMIRDGVTYRIVCDHLGSPRLVIDVTTGNVAQRIDYDEFGNVVTDTNPGFQPFGFAGGLYDRDTKLVRFGSRDYDPTIGRWTAKDPLLFGGRSANLYTYVSNNPISLTDPTGQIWPILAAAAVIGGVANTFNALQAGKTDTATLAEAFAVGAVGGIVGVVAAVATDSPSFAGGVNGLVVTAGNRYIVDVTNADNTFTDFGLGVGLGVCFGWAASGRGLSANGEALVSGNAGMGATAIINAVNAWIDSLNGTTLKGPESPGP